MIGLIVNSSRELLNKYQKMSSEDIFLNQWTSTSERWLPAGVWEECFEEKKLEKDSKIILAFDGSYSRDSQLLSEYPLIKKPHLEVLGHWERPVTENALWKVPREEVLLARSEIFEKYDVANLLLIRWDGTTNLEN